MTLTVDQLSALVVARTVLTYEVEHAVSGSYRAACLDAIAERSAP